MIALVTLLAVSLALPLAAETRGARLARVLQLESERRTGGQELSRYLQDPEPGVRRRAALAAGRIGNLESVGTLLPLLTDVEPEVRLVAAFSLGLIGDGAAGEHLVAALQDHDSRVRARAAEAIGRLGIPAHAPVLAEFIQARIPDGAPLLTIRGDDPANPADPWLELRLGLFALARLEDSEAIADALLAEGRPRFDWWAATYVVSRVPDGRLRPILSQSTGSDEPFQRTLAARGLATFDDAAAVRQLLELALDPDPYVAIAALRGLAGTGERRAAELAARILKGSSDVGKRREALRALARLPVDVSIREDVIALLGDQEPAIRAETFSVVARIDRQQFTLILAGLDPEPEWLVRAGLARGLAAAGDDISLGVLFRMLNEEDDVRVLPSILEALRTVRGADSIPTLRGYLDHADIAVRAAAAEQLDVQGPGGHSGALAVAYQRSLGDSEVGARIAILGGLEKEDDELGRETLRQAAASDPMWAVRREAAKAVGGTAERPSLSGAAAPLDLRLAMAPYLSLGAPLYSPRAVVDTDRGRIELLLDIVETPITTQAFVTLARRGFYDGLTFHRVVPGFVIQGGDPRGDGHGGPGTHLPDEPGLRPFGRGAVGMALDGPDTAGSRFFITQAPAPHLDGRFTLFGRVVSGMDVVDRIQPGDVIRRVEIWDGS